MSSGASYLQVGRTGRRQALSTLASWNMQQAAITTVFTGQVNCHDGKLTDCQTCTCGCTGGKGGRMDWEATCRTCTCGCTGGRHEGGGWRDWRLLQDMHMWLLYRRQKWGRMDCDADCMTCKRHSNRNLNIQPTSQPPAVGRVELDNNNENTVYFQQLLCA